MQSKTIKQLADELGVGKQRVYRYIKKNHINEAHQENGVMYYDEAVETRIIRYFSENTVSSDVHHEAHQETPEAHHDVHQSTSSDTATSSGNDTTNDRTTEYINNLKEQISTLMADKDKLQEQHIADKAILQEQLKVKDEQLRAKDTQINNLTEVNKNLSQSINVERHTDLAETLIQGNVDTQSKEDNSHKNNFFSRIFKKKK